MGTVVRVLVVGAFIAIIIATVVVMNIGPSDNSSATRDAADGTAKRVPMPQVPLASWITIDAGTFTAGSPEGEAGREAVEELHKVTLTHSFRMLATEVTQNSFKAWMGFNPSEYVSSGYAYPVEQVTWHEAAAYCNALSKSTHVALCYHCDRVNGEFSCEGNLEHESPVECPGFRLPTEAEWEYAARAGERRATHSGDLDTGRLECEHPNPSIDTVAWTCGNSGGETHRVALLEPNSWGLYDMLGNVWEWCHDWYGPTPTGPTTDPFGPSVGETRVNRGGGWEYEARFARLGQRSSDEPTLRCHGLGFRIVKTIFD